MGMAGPSPELKRGAGGIARLGAAVLATLLAAATLTAAATATPSSSQKLTAVESFARDVLGEAIVPPGARLTGVARSGALAGSFGEIGAPGCLDVHRFYLVGAGPDAVEDYLAAHVPRGATQLEKGSGNGPHGILFVDLAYYLPVSGPHRYSAELIYTTAPTGSGAELRVDSEVVWEPSHPADERAPAGGVIAVTGYSQISLAQNSSGPVTATVSGARARSIIGALNALPLAPRAGCFENPLLFELVVRRSAHSARSLTVAGWGCAGIVVVTAHGRTMPELNDASGLLLCAVVRVLPAHEAEGTRSAGLSCTPPASAPRTAATRISVAALARLTTIARAIANANGDLHATDAIAVATTHASALRVATPGDATPSVPAGMPVYLVTMRGRFTALGSSPPAGAPLPRGTFLAVVVDAATFEVTDWGLGARASKVQLASLGRVYPLHWAGTVGARDPAAAGGLTTRLELSRTTVRAGEPIGAELVVTNPGPRVNETHDCAPYLMVVLADKEIPADAVIPTPCRLAPFWIRHGVSRLGIVVSTRYDVCTQTPAQATVRLPVCLSGPVEVPPLPAGRYRTVAVGAWGGIPMPAAVAVTLEG